MARPSDYTEEIAAEICEHIANGNSMRTICAADGMPAPATVYRWLIEREAFQEQYARARERQADFYAEEIIQISDDGANDTYATDTGEATNHDVIARSRLRVDARKWYASKLAPKKYGEKITQELTGKDGGSLVVEIVRFSDKP
jgi:hypothetical protein